MLSSFVPPPCREGRGTLLSGGRPGLDVSPHSWGLRRTLTGFAFDPPIRGKRNLKKLFDC